METQQLNEQSCGVTSSSTRRILLQCLENMSSPLSVKFLRSQLIAGVFQNLSLVENINFVVISILTGCKKNSMCCFFSSELCKLIFKFFT